MLLATPYLSTIPQCTSRILHNFNEFGLSGLDTRYLAEQNPRVKAVGTQGMIMLRQCTICLSLQGPLFSIVHW